MLSRDWITEGHIDFEYKKYLLLGYLKKVNKCFYKKELFPSLSDLVFHFRNLKDLQQKKILFQNEFPEQIKNADLNRAMLIYEKLVKDSELMKELESIISFSIPKLKLLLDEGKQMYDFYESQMEIEPIGISPMRLDEGYMFLSRSDSVKSEVYAYTITIFQQNDENYRGIHTTFIQSFRNSISKTYESVKRELIQSRKHLPTPAVFLIRSGLYAPLKETFLPIAKRMLVKEVAVMTNRRRVE